MKRIRVIILTLVLSITMLAPEFSMLPAAYAEDKTPAPSLTQSADSVGAAAAPAAAETAALAAGAPDAGTSAGAAPNPESAVSAEAGLSAATETGSGDRTKAAPAAVDPTPTAAGAPSAAAASDAGAPSANPADPAAPEALSAGALSADAADQSDPAAAANDAGTDSGAGDPSTDPAAFGSYDLLKITELYDAKKLVIPEEMQSKITVTKSNDGSGLMLTGTVADLSSVYLTIDKEFDFDSGDVGRMYIDGLKDKDVGMNVEVEVYLDGCKSPAVTIPLKKQMGKTEWSNKGEKSVSLGSSEISGKHTVALLLKITGKKETATTSVLLRSIRFCKTTVPVLYFNIDESQGTIEAMNSSKDAECTGTVDLVVPAKFDADNTFKDEYGKQDSLQGLDIEYIRGRGNSTWMFNKKPYKLKFDKGQDLFGFGKNKHWVLLANSYDKSLIHNRMTFWLGQQLGLEYTPQCVPVEVVMNGEFYGSYFLTEQVRVGEGRISIDDLDDQDPQAITDERIRTGGYLLSLDPNGDNMFTTESGVDFTIESPETNASYFSDYIKEYIQKTENALCGEDFKDAEGHPYTDYLDLDAAVNYWWVQEFSSNGDAYINGSTYLYKKRQSDADPGKLYWGPLWDFDSVAWGGTDHDIPPRNSIDTTGMDWFDIMMRDPMFVNKVKARWSKEYSQSEEGSQEDKVYLKDKLNEITKEGGRLDKYIEQMETTYMYDWEKNGSKKEQFTEYREVIEQLRTWINERTEAVDKAVSELTTDPHHVTFMADGEVVSEVDVVGKLAKKDIPEAPEKPGFTFREWTDEEGKYYGENTKITKDVVLIANYIEKGEGTQAKDIFFDHYEVYVQMYEAEDKTMYAPVFSVMPADAGDSKITWTSTDDKIAEPDNDLDTITIYKTGDVTITGTLSNGVSKSIELHVVRAADMHSCESVELDKTSLTLEPGEYSQVLTVASPAPCETPKFIWISTDEEVAKVNKIGVVTAVAPGTADVIAVNVETSDVLKCKVTVKGDGGTPGEGDGGNTPADGSGKPNAAPADQTGTVVNFNGSNYVITSDTADSKTAMLVEAKNAKRVELPAYIESAGKQYSVNAIYTEAFAKSKATKLTIKTKTLTKAGVKGSLKGSKVKRIKVKVGKKKLNKKYVKKYRKYFTKKNSGKKVKVS